MSYPRTVLAFLVGNLAGGGVAAAFFTREQSKKHVLPPAARGPESYFKYGYPRPSTTFRTYSEHSLVYDHSRKIPLWVSETLTAPGGSSNERASRSNCTFRPDPSIPTVFSSSNTDYSKSGWSRGHMAAAGNKKHSQKAMDETFYLTNIIPQDVDNNSGYWNRIEMFCRMLTKQFKEVHVISGPLFLPEVDKKSKKKYVKYEVIGDGRVAVPTHLFKVVLGENENMPPSLGVFIVPNEDIKKEPLTSFQVPLEQLEATTGWVFFPNLNKKMVVDLCSEGHCKLMSQEKIDMMILNNRLNAAKSLSELEKIWKKRNIKTDQALERTFNKRKAELQAH